METSETETHFIYRTFFIHLSKSDISSGEPCSFTKVPDGPSDLKSYWPPGPRKEPRYTFLFSQKSRQTNPSRFLSGAPMKREARFEGIFRSLKNPSCGFPSKEALPRGLLHGNFRERDTSSTELSSSISQSPR